MIPKIIHYCWFGKGPIPASQKVCIKSWRKIMPDYQIMRWDEKTFNINKFSVSKHAYNVKKYALVSDVCRYNVLYEYGGIYLDTDVEVFQKFDKFLDANFFSALELFKEFYSDLQIAQMLNEDGTPKCEGVDIPKMEMLTSTMGCVAGNSLINDLRNYYNNIEADDDWAYNYRNYVNNDRLVARFATKYGFKYVNQKQVLDHNMVIYPTGIFGHAWSVDDKYEVSYHYNATSWEHSIGRKQRKQAIIEKFHLLFLQKTYKKLKSLFNK